MAIVAANESIVLSGDGLTEELDGIRAQGFAFTAGELRDAVRAAARSIEVAHQA